MIKREKGFFILLAGLAMLFSALVVLHFLQSAKIEQIVDENSNLRNKVSQIEENLYLDKSIESDIKIANEDFANFLTAIKGQRLLWDDFLDSKNNIYSNHSPASTSSVNANLVRLYSSLHLRCKNSGISFAQSNLDSDNVIGGPIESPTKFGFGFGSYEGFWPSFSKEEANLLDTQAKIVKEIIDALASSVSEDQNINLHYIKREAAGPVDSKHIGADLMYPLDDTFLVRRVNVIDSLAFEISFDGRTENARSFINQLRPPFSVRKFTTSRMGSMDESNLPSAFEGEEKSEIIPIIRNIRSVFTIHIEYITKVNFNIESFIKMLPKTGKDIEIYSTLLEQIKDTL